MLRLLFMLALFAVAIYLLVRVVQDRGLATPRGSRPARPTRPPRQAPRAVAPDDDEDFLRDLDRKRLNPEDPEA